MTVREEMAKLAATWWADHLRAGLAPSVMEQAGWEPKQVLEGLMIDGMTRMILDRAQQLTPKEIDLFEEKLTLIIRDGYGPGIPGGRFRLSVDYHPERALTDALEAAGIDLRKTACHHRFPLKTDMYITDESVEVGVGYRAPKETLYTSKRAVIREMVCAREWPVFKPWYEAEEPIVVPLCKAREEIAKKHNWNWNHPEVVAAQKVVIDAMEPRKKRDENWRNTRDHLIDSLPLMPGGPIEGIVNDIWEAIVASDAAYMAERMRIIRERVENAPFAHE